MKKILPLFLLLAGLTGCQSTTPLETWLTPEKQAGWQTKNIAVEDFVLRGYIMSQADHPVLRIYIEGDGHAWLRPTVQSPDPTPYHPLMLQLAAEDIHKQVAYLARPCQYTMPTHPAQNCDKKYWGQARFAPEVIRAMNQAIDDLKQSTGAQKVALIGYSGGGGIAVLLAARRDDVQNLRTIAGNLDHQAFTDYHQLSPMTQSLNPADVAADVVDIPQIHFAGGKDEVVVPQIAEAYARALPHMACTRLASVPWATHTQGWVETWPRLVWQKPACKND